MEKVTNTKLFFVMFGNICFYLSFIVLALNLLAIAEGEVLHNFLRMIMDEFIYGNNVLGFILAVSLIILNVLIVHNFMVLNKRLTNPHIEITDFERLDSIIYVFVYVIILVLILTN